MKQRQHALADLLREQLSHGLTVRLRVTSNSMHPLIRAGDEVELAYVADPTCLQAGNIVTFEQAGLTTHRLIGQVDQAGGCAWLTQGDNTLLPDPPWADACLVGRVIAVWPPAGPGLRLDTGLGQRLDACLRRMLRVERGLLRVAHVRMPGGRRAPLLVQRLGRSALRRLFRWLAALVVGGGRVWLKASR